MFLGSWNVREVKIRTKPRLGMARQSRRGKEKGGKKEGIDIDGGKEKERDRMRETTRLIQSSCINYQPGLTNAWVFPWAAEKEKSEWQIKQKEMTEDACSWFTTYHRRRRHPDGHHGHGHRTNARTGNVPSRKHGHSRSLVYRSSPGTGTDRADRRRSHTWMDHRMRYPRIAVAPAPVKI